MTCKTDKSLWLFTVESSEEEEQEEEEEEEKDDDQTEEEEEEEEVEEEPPAKRTSIGLKIKLPLLTPKSSSAKKSKRDRRSGSSRVREKWTQIILDFQ